MGWQLTAEEILAQKSVNDAQISPDGQWVAFVVAEAAKVDTRRPRSRVWLVSTRGGKPRELTAGPGTDHSPRWSPDGSTLAFLSDRRKDGEDQIQLLGMTGGEAIPLTDLAGGLSGPSWAADGRSLLFLRTDPDPVEEKKRRDEKDDAILFEKHPRFQRVYRVDLETRAVECLTGDYQVWEFELAPDSSQLALIASDQPYSWSWYQSRLMVMPARASAEPRKLSTPRKQLAHPRWSPDGTCVAFLACTWSDCGVIGGDAWVVSAVSRGAAANLTAGTGGSFSWLEWEADGGSLLATGHQQGRICLARVGTGGRPEVLWAEEAQFGDRSQPKFTRSADGRKVAVTREDALHPRDVWVAEFGDAGLQWSPLTDLHPEIGDWHLGRTESVTWNSSDGLEIHGLLMYPPDYEPGERYPLVVAVHGGPASLWAHRFYAAAPAWPQYLASRGCVVLMPNPRGSSGFGVEFTEANLGDMGGMDLQDILTGVDHCVALGIADPNRLGVGGWSYGGFMTAWAVTQTARFRAAVMGAGISNWRSFHGVSDIPTWDELFHQAQAYQPGPYERMSPVTYAARVCTPTLILHGEQDACVPVGQAYEFFRALKDHGIPVELVVYPREGHGIAEHKHLEDLYGRLGEWFVRHLAAV